MPRDNKHRLGLTFGLPVLSFILVCVSQNAIHATAPAVWLPYTALEHLMERLRTSSPDSELGQVRAA